jgi:hypothetical protein
MKPGLQSSFKQPCGTGTSRCIGRLWLIAGGFSAAAVCQAQAMPDKAEAAVPRIELSATVAPAPGAAAERSQTHMKLWLSDRDNGVGVGIGRVGPEGLPSSATASATATAGPGAPQAASWSWSLRRDLGGESRLMVEQVYAPGETIQRFIDAGAAVGHLDLVDAATLRWCGADAAHTAVMGGGRTRISAQGLMSQSRSALVNAATMAGPRGACGCSHSSISAGSA